MKNQHKTSANYAKQFIKKKGKSSITQIDDSEDLVAGPSFKCKFYEKEHGPNKCLHLQTECHYYYDVGYIVKFCKKKWSLKTSMLKKLVTYTQKISSPIN